MARAEGIDRSVTKFIRQKAEVIWVLLRSASLPLLRTSNNLVPEKLEFFWRERKESPRRRRILAGAEGIEPPSFGFGDRRSTTELRAYVRGWRPEVYH